jgi:hypothetical protein
MKSVSETHSSYYINGSNPIQHSDHSIVTLDAIFPAICKQLPRPTNAIPHATPHNALLQYFISISSDCTTAKQLFNNIPVQYTEEHVIKICDAKSQYLSLNA